LVLSGASVSKLILLCWLFVLFIGIVLLSDKKNNGNSVLNMNMFCTGSIGFLTGLAIVGLLLSNEVMAALELYLFYLALLIILVVAWCLFRYGIRRNAHVAWRSVVLVLLLNFIILFSVVVYVLLFNLLNLFYYPNPLLVICNVTGKLSGIKQGVFICITIAMMIILNLYVTKRNIRSSDTGFRKVRHPVRIGICMLLLLVVLSFIIPLYMSMIIDSKYEQVLSDFRSYEEENCSSTKVNLTCIWNLVKRYSKEFSCTYAKPCPKPKQLLVRIPPLVDNIDFVAKLAVVSRSGACLDFALSITKLIRDLNGYETRVVEFVGWDHVIPEVKINNTWYVIDITYTTPGNPVDIDHYVSYLQHNKTNVYNHLKGFVDFETGEDLSKEHHLKSEK